MRSLVFALLIAAFAACHAQQSITPGQKSAAPPAIDGVVTDGEWKQAPTLTGNYDEQTGSHGPYDQKFFLTYDEHYIYIAAQLVDPEPDKIRATETRSNVSVNGDDFIIFLCDPFGALQDGNQFRINPRGATTLQLAGGRAAKREWVGEIEAKGRITKEGWEVEARIPWSIMRLPAPGKRTLRASFGRVLARVGRAYLVDNISGNQEKNVGLWTDVEVPKPAVARSIKLLPYVYGGWDREDGHIANAGLDFKLPVTSDLDFAGSINPDFRNIENQVLSIDHSYFERLAGESRPFFLEGKNYFQTSQDAPLFASQRIRNFDFGAKTYGKIGDRTTLGVLNATDFGNRNAFAANVTTQFDPLTGATAAITDLDTPGHHNRATYLDVNRTIGNSYVFAQHSTTTDTDAGEGHRYNLGGGYARDGLNVGAEFLEISANYNPRLGFAPQRNLRGYLGNVEFNRPVKWGRISEIGVGVNASRLDKIEGDGLFRSTLDLTGSATLRDGFDIDAALQFEEFEGFKDRSLYLSIEHPRGDPYRHWQLDYVIGNIADHRYESVRPSFQIRPYRNLQLQASYQRVDHFEVREQFIGSANYELNPNDALSGRVIREGKDTNFYLAWRRTGNRGNEYFVILGDPNARTFRTALVVKASFPFELRF